eukprot:1059059-Prorocentrum_minimum.AAC.1
MVDVDPAPDPADPADSPSPSRDWAVERSQPPPAAPPRCHQGSTLDNNGVRKELAGELNFLESDEMAL